MGFAQLGRNNLAAAFGGLGRGYGQEKPMIGAICGGIGGHIAGLFGATSAMEEARKALEEQRVIDELREPDYMRRLRDLSPIEAPMADDLLRVFSGRLK